MRTLALCLACFLAACSSSPSPEPQPSVPDAPSPVPAPLPAPLHWAACKTADWPDGFALPAAGVECTTIAVPLDHAHKDDGRTFPLRVAREKSRAFPSGRAVFQIAGGPGGTSVGQSGTIPRLLPGLLEHFDLVYVDQRGTGGSRYLGCSSGYPATKDEWAACASEHASDDLAHDSTLESAHDLESVRAALGYAKMHVRAGSYGTRLALELLRQHESSVEAVVLDGVDPPDNTFFEDFIRATDRGVARLAKDCGESAECKAITADIVADLAAHRAAVKKTPRSILVDGARQVEDEQTLLDVLGAALADAALRFRIPRAIHAAASGDFTAWDAVIGDLFGASVSEPAHGDSFAPPLRRVATRMHGTPYVAPGLYMTILCSEDLPNAGSLDDLRALEAAQTWGGDPGVLDIAEACASWRLQPLDASLRLPVRSNAKVLLLNGDLDLNTFPEWGAHAAATLPNATNLVVPYATHSTMSVPCAAQILTDFLDNDGDVTKLDTSCLASLHAPAW